MTGIRANLLAAITLLVTAGCASTHVDADRDGFIVEVDCDDDNADVHPDAQERCNGVDDNCDGQVDGSSAVDATLLWTDADADGFGPDRPTLGCPSDALTASMGGDCDDDDPTTHPGAEERCDDIDHDCDGELFEGAVDAVERFEDVDGDGYAGTSLGVSCADAPTLAEDCDDDDPRVSPDAVEVCDDVDQDCDGSLGFDVVVGVHATDLPASLDLARDGDRVCIPAGTWRGPTVLGSRQLTLVGAGREATLLDGDGERVLDVSGGELTLRDLSLTRGVANRGALIRSSNSRLTLERVDLTFADDAGAGDINGLALDFRDVHATLRDVSLTDVDVRGIDHGEGALMIVNGGSLHLDGLVLARIRVEASWLKGIMSWSATTVTGQGFEAYDLELGKAGRGAGVLVSGSNVELSDLSFHDIEFDGYNGGLWWLTGSTVSLSQVDFENIHAPDNFGVLIWADNDDRGRLDLWRLRVHDVWSQYGNVFYTTGPVTAENFVIGRIFDTHDDSDGYSVGAFSTSTFEESDAPQIVLRQGTLLYHRTWTPRLLTMGRGRAQVVNVDFRTGTEHVVEARGATSRIDVSHCNMGSDAELGLEQYRGVVTEGPVHYYDEVGYNSFDGGIGSWDMELATFSPLRDLGDPDLTDPDGSRSDIGACGGPRGGCW